MQREVAEHSKLGLTAETWEHNLMENDIIKPHSVRK